MKKTGFTLAEVLVTIVVIGVIAALVAPPMVQDFSKAHIGPTLQRVITTLEAANADILREHNSDDLLLVANTPQEYRELLANHIPRSSANYDLTNGVYILEYDEHGKKGKYSNRLRDCLGFHFSDNIDIAMGGALATNGLPDTVVWAPSENPKGSYLQIIIDINGHTSRPNKYGRDNFFFTIDRSGAVIAHGSYLMSDLVNWMTAWDGTNTSGSSNDMGQYVCNKNRVTDGYGCAGSIVDNNWKVIY